MKYLIILALLGYVFYKIGSFLFRAGAASQHMRNFQEQQRKQNTPPAAAKTKAKGGEYVDYEEVK
jgi:hypothetical protein